MKRAFALFSLLASSSLTFAAMNVDSAHARRDDMRGVGKGASARRGAPRQQPAGRSPLPIRTPQTGKRPLRQRP
jgi:hypothetical protein